VIPEEVGGLGRFSDDGLALEISEEKMSVGERSEGRSRTSNIVCGPDVVKNSRFPSALKKHPARVISENMGRSLITFNRLVLKISAPFQKIIILAALKANGVTERLWSGSKIRVQH